MIEIKVATSCLKFIQFIHFTQAKGLLQNIFQIQYDSIRVDSQIITKVYAHNIRMSFFKWQSSLIRKEQERFWTQTVTEIINQSNAQDQRMSGFCLIKPHANRKMHFCRHYLGYLLLYHTCFGNLIIVYTIHIRYSTHPNNWLYCVHEWSIRYETMPIEDTRYIPQGVICTGLIDWVKLIMPSVH